MTKRQLFDRGKVHVHHWCGLNGVEEPTIVESDEPRDYDTCAFYRDGTVTICVNACAAEGHVGRMWSYPGYAVDRTPYGVLAHELGHHVDKAHGPRGGLYGRDWRERTQEAPLTGYCDNDNEWFAEVFRLFVTNPDLLRCLRPLTFALMKERWPNVAEERSWERVLAMAPRQTAAAQNKVDAAARVARRTTKVEQGSLLP